jgi:hypothetical protein
MDPIDDIVRDAMKALEARSTPRDYFDDLPERINVRLEGSMQTEHQSDAGHSSDGIVSHEADQENSGLHDIKALAQTTKTRVRRRQTSQHDIDQTLLAHSQSGLHAVALPDPAKMVQLPSVEEARALARTTAGMPAATADDDVAPARTTTSAREPAEERGKGVPAWMWAGGGLAAAAAAVMAFVMLNGKDNTAEPKADPAAKEQVAQGPAPAKAAAQPAAEELAPPPAPPAEEGITTGGIAADPAPAATATPEPDAEAEPERAKKKERDKADEKKEIKKDAKSDVIAPPKDTGKVDDKKDEKKEDKKDKAKEEATKKLEGAILGEGDSDELGIGDALGGGDKKKDEAPAKTELTNQEVRDGLDAINGKAKACYGAHGQTGTVKVKLTIASSGKVSKASASGDLAGTPAGDCVVAAVKSATFPAWEGAPKSTSYVVLLSD